MLKKTQSHLALMTGLLWGTALVGCSGLGDPAGLSVDDKRVLDDPLLEAELLVYGICSTTTTRFDEEANRCAAVLTQTTIHVAAVQSIAKSRAISDTMLDNSAAAVGKYDKICDPEDAEASIVDCLAAAEDIKSNSTVYVETLRAKLNATK